MLIGETGIAGVRVVDIEPRRDERGFFARVFCVDEFAAAGLETAFPQHSVSWNARCGTLRGMHFQNPPHAEAKVVTCLRGAIHDVVLDLRAGSPTYLRWEAFTLSAANHRRLYIPRGCAHGFLTLSDDVEVLYLISDPHVPEAARGFRHDDPAFGIVWPFAPSLVSERDLAWPPFRDHEAASGSSLSNP